MSVENRAESALPTDEAENTEIDEVYGIVALKVTRDTIHRHLVRHCNTIDSVLIDRSSRDSVLIHRAQIAVEIDDLRKAHSDYVEALREDNQALGDPYTYISKNESMVRVIIGKMDSYLEELSATHSTASGVHDTHDTNQDTHPPSDGLETRSQVGFSQDADCRLDSHNHQNDYNRNSSPVSSVGSYTSSYREYKRPRYVSEFDHKSLTLTDWIDQKQYVAIHLPHSINPMWMMNAIPQFKIEPFPGDPKEWPTFLSSFMDMIRDVLPSDSQRLGVR